MQSRILNFTVYQLGWIACVLGAAHGETVWLICASVLLALHLCLARPFGKHAVIVLMGAAVGTLVESILSVLCVYRFPVTGTFESLPPLWIIILWMQFTTLLPYCLAWLSRRYFLAASLGLFGGPLAFVGGEKLGGVQFLPPRIFHLVILGCLWSMALPLLVWIVDSVLGTPRQPYNYRWLRSG